MPKLVADLNAAFSARACCSMKGLQKRVIDTEVESGCRAQSPRKLSADLRLTIFCTGVGGSPARVERLDSISVNSVFIWS